jgi:hypothetical protein
LRFSRLTAFELNGTAAFIGASIKSSKEIPVKTGLICIGKAEIRSALKAFKVVPHKKQDAKIRKEGGIVCNLMSDCNKKNYMNTANNKAGIPNPALKPFEILIGEWKTAGTHPLVPGTMLQGHTSFNWIEGGAFLRMSSSINHEKFPDGIAIFGSDDALRKYFMLYFDERGVSRKQDVSFQNNILKWWRNSPEFSQAYTFTFTDDRDTIIGKGELSKDGTNWERDLDLTYTRVR